MSEQDDADVIKQVPRQFNFPAVPGVPALHGVIGTGRRRLVVIAAACALLVTAATLVTFRLTEGPRTDPALAGLITEVTTVPVGKSVPGLPGLPASASSASAYSSTLLISPGTLNAVGGPPLTRSGKPEVLYVATEYCPYCAMENWPLIVALSRFGQFTGLTTSRSPEFEHIAPIDSWTFYGSRYTSPYLVFVPIEQHSNVLVNAKANPNADKSYRVLQKLAPARTGRLRRIRQARFDPVPGLRQPRCPDRLGSHPPSADDRQVMAAARRRPPAAEDGPRRGLAQRGGLAHRRTLPPHRRPPRLRLPGIPQERRVPLLKGKG